MAPTVLLALATSAAVLAGCSEANGQPQGGEPLTTDPCADAGSTWTDLYGCYFGPTGKASCSALGTECHGSVNDSPGGVFVCGQTQESCYQGMIHAAGFDGGTAGPMFVVTQLRTSDGGIMPCNPIVIQGDPGITCNLASAGAAYTFTADDIARINAWIAAGAPE